MRRIVRWCLVLALYFGTVVHFLQTGAHGTFCMYCGPSPGLWWGEPPHPPPREYFRNRAYYDRLLLMPYLAAGLFATVAGCVVAVSAARRFGASRGRAVIAAAGGTLGVTVLAAAVSDLGAHAGLWNATIFLLHGDYGEYTLLVVLPRVFLPAPLLSGLLALARSKSVV